MTAASPDQRALYDWLGLVIARLVYSLAITASWSFILKESIVVLASVCVCVCVCECVCVCVCVCIYLSPFIHRAQFTLLSESPHCFASQMAPACSPALSEGHGTTGPAYQTPRLPPPLLPEHLRRTSTGISHRHGNPMVAMGGSRPGSKR